MFEQGHPDIELSPSHQGWGLGSCESGGSSVDPHPALHSGWPNVEFEYSIFLSQVDQKDFREITALSSSLSAQPSKSHLSKPPNYDRLKAYGTKVTSESWALLYRVT